MIQKYAYVMITEGSCSFCDDNSVYMVDKTIPVPDLIMLMLKNSAISCETYETNNSDNISDWKRISTFGSIMGEGVFNTKS